MARRKTAAKGPTEAASTPDIEPAMTPLNDDAPEPARAADPASKISVSLSGYRGGPAVHLLRSQRFKQMQIRFDGEQPAEKHLARLKETGWKDRTESEGVWTKQIDPAARWQSVQQMEREFKDVANAIRKDKGLAPALEGLAMA